MDALHAVDSDHELCFLTDQLIYASRNRVDHEHQEHGLSCAAPYLFVSQQDAFLALRGQWLSSIGPNQIPQSVRDGGDLGTNDVGDHGPGYTIRLRATGKNAIWMGVVLAACTNYSSRLLLPKGQGLQRPNVLQEGWDPQGAQQTSDLAPSHGLIRRSSKNAATCKGTRRIFRSRNCEKPGIPSSGS